MSFIVVKLLGLLAHPSVVVIAMIAAGVLLRWRGLAGAGVALLLAIVLLPLDDWASRPLEDRYPRREPQRVDGIVVLGGAVEEKVSADRGTPSLNGAAARLIAMADLARRWPDATVIFSGGSGQIDPGPVVEADVVRDMLPALGVAPGRVLFDRRSRTTIENVTESEALGHPRPEQCWLLVTSALHLPRATADFDQAGWATWPWPVGYTTRSAALAWLEPPGSRITRLDNATHEWAGLAVAALHRLLSRAEPAPVSGCTARSPA